MEFTDNIIVLLRQNFRERDRMICVYSQNHGRMALRLPGVNRSDSKLKAISETFVNSCSRIYIRRNATIGCITGGKLKSVYPNIRQDIKKMEMASYFCELFYRLTPLANPNPAKFELLQNAMQTLENYPVNQVIAPAFLLRLMQESGFGLKDRPVLEINEKLWGNIHTLPFDNLAFLNDIEVLDLNKMRYVCQRFLNRYLSYPLHTIKQLELTTSAQIQEDLKEFTLEPVFS
ncbi:MAG: DNA repair protein RecO, partial [Elusimicrobiaceae bacterium]|nr:DNA repair protein RecO [Elusimicrobiaceae bacterium]